MREWDEPSGEPVENGCADGDDRHRDQAWELAVRPTSSPPVTGAADSGADSVANDPVPDPDIEPPDGWLPA